MSKLSQHGFTVDYVNMDGASTNKLFMHMCEDLWQSKYMISNVFQRDHKICLLQDIKHVLKKIRNNMESSRSENKSKPGRYIIKKLYPNSMESLGRSVQIQYSGWFSNSSETHRGTYIANTSFQNEKWLGF